MGPSRLLSHSLTHSLLLFWLSFYYAAAARLLLFSFIFLHLFRETFLCRSNCSLSCNFFSIISFFAFFFFFFFLLLYRNFYTILLSVVTWMFHLIHFFFFSTGTFFLLFIQYNVCVCVSQFDLYCKNCIVSFYTQLKLHWQILNFSVNQKQFKNIFVHFN